MPNPFYVDPTQGYDPNALSGLGQALRVNRQEREQAESKRVEQEQSQQKQVELSLAMESGDPAKISAAAVKYPEVSKALYEGLGISQDEQQKGMTLFSRQLMSAEAGDIAGMYEQRIADIELKGGDASQSKEGLADWLQHQDLDKEHKDASILFSLSDPEGYKQYASEQEDAEKGGGIGTVSPKDFTVESLTAYSDSGDIGDLVRFSPQVKDIAGIPHQYNQGSLKWEPLVDMRSPEIAEQTVAQAEMEADKQSRLDFSKDRNTFMSGESKLISKISSARSKQDLMSGWNTKYGSSLSSLLGTEARELKGLINTLKANSAFTTLADLKESGGTLGAISAPELTLLEAAMGTIDQGGDIPEQVRVIDQILKANESAIARLDNAYAMDKKRYSGNYDDAQVEVNQEQSQAKQGGEIQIDAQGNRAMVYPDGTFEEL